MKRVEIGIRGDHASTLDVDALIGSRMLVQANSGGGKSWMLRKLAERLAMHVPIIILDLEGEFATLREKYDVLLVGQGREVPAQVEIAGALALRLLEHRVSAVIDLYELPLQQRRAYVRRFIESLMAAPKRMWSPLAVFVDEAHVLAPETGESEATDAVCSLMCQGRKRDFCGILATQRLSKLHKDAAAEANNGLIGRATLDVDLKRAGDALGMGKSDWPRIRDLEPGEFWAYGPAFNHRGVEKIRCGAVETTHGRKARDARLPAPSTAMKGTIGELADLAAKAKTEIGDIDAAKARIRELERQVAAKPVSVVDSKEIDKRDDQIRKVLGELERSRAEASRLADELRAIAKAASGAAMALSNSPRIRFSAPQPRQVVATASPAPKVHTNGTAKVAELDGMTKAQVRILDALAWLKASGQDRPSSKAVGLLSGIDATGGYFSNTIGPLCSSGLVDRQSGTCALTEQGLSLVDVPANVSLDEYHSRVRETLDRLGGKTLAMFDAIVSNGPGEMSAEAVGAAVGVDHTGGYFSNNIGPLGTLGLIDRSRGVVRTTEIMFPRGLA